MTSCSSSRPPSSSRASPGSRTTRATHAIQAQAVGESIAADAPPAAAAVDVKPDAPGQAVLDAIAEYHPDRIIVAVREGDATWLEDEELNRVPGQIAGVPVTRVEI